MNDLINRQAAIDLLDQAKKIILSMFEALPKDEEAKMRMEIIYGVVDSIKPFLEKVPSAQPEIIRCKNCKYWREGTAFSYCDKLHGMGVLDTLDYMTAEDDYCSMAERRTDE